ncbi:MAG: AAA family ATPase [Desulfosalsimonadaceae bacterium]
MRIASLQLISFGPFTNAHLDFGSRARGLHLVYGPNEAGKSSALRGLRALFYGISERSPDDFIHPYPKMRIGGSLCSSSGERLDVIRRKGRVNTLRASDDRTVVAESVLAGFLNNVDAELFATMFGIGYEDLVAGGREIVAGGGDLGQLVFSAGSGIVRLKEVRDALGAEAEALFKPSGQKPAINAAISNLRENDKRLRETQLPGKEWARLDGELNQALSRRGAVDRELSAKQKARSHLARIRDALPLIARRRELLDSLKDYEQVVLLPEDFSEIRQNLETELDMAEKEAERAERAIHAINEEMQGLCPEEAVLDNAELIEKFHQELGSQQKAAADRIKWDTSRSTLLGEAGEILRGLSGELSVDDAEKLRIKKERAASIRRLASEYEQISTRMESAREALPGLTREIGRLEAEKKGLEEPRDSRTMESLRAEVSSAAELGPLEKQNQQAIADLDHQKESLFWRLQRLGISASCSRDLEKLHLPASETIQGFEDRFAAADRRLEELSREQAKVEEEIRETRSRIQARQMAQSVVSEADLEEARSRRDRGWRLIRKKLAGEEPEPRVLSDYLGEALVPENQEGKEQPLASPSLEFVFEGHIKAADSVSDRLRREADRVAEHARLVADHSAAEQKKKETEQALEEAEREKEELSAEWDRLWAPIGLKAESPREMERWRRQAEALQEEFAAYEKSRRQAENTGQAINASRKALAERLKAFGREADPQSESLARLIHRARQILEDQEQLALTHEKLESELSARRKELEAAKSRLEASEKALSCWRSQWAEAVAPLGLSGDCLPSEADAVMEELRSLFDKLKEADKLEKRIHGIDRDRESFAKGVRSLAETAAPELSGNAPGDAVLKLHHRLTHAREARTRYAELYKQLTAEQNNLEKAGKNASETRSRLVRMCGEAGCAEFSELRSAEAKSRKRRELESERKSVEEQILAVSGGATVEEFAARAAEVDPDTIEPEIERLDELIAGLSAERNDLAETIGRLNNELSKMDGSAEAARLAEERQEILGRLDPEARRYIRLRLSIHILDRAIERFREKNQAPMLRRASELFAAITCGAYAGVRAEFDESGRPVIAGVRGGEGDVVHVLAMSDGTADQLYLSLRLAGLEMAIQKAEPMPFIVDDILIKFDNNRAVAALKVLAELSARTQVIFFTHHHHLLELAEEHLPADALCFHQL